MPNKMDIELNKSWVCEHLCNVTNVKTKKAAWVLVQEPGFIGFGVVVSKDIYFPPAPNMPLGWKPDWDLGCVYI